MPVPFEVCALTFFAGRAEELIKKALIPFALLTVCFGATGTLFSIAKRATNDGKVSLRSALQLLPITVGNEALTDDPSHRDTTLIRGTR